MCSLLIIVICRRS